MSQKNNVLIVEPALKLIDYWNKIENKISQLIETHQAQHNFSFEANILNTIFLVIVS